MSYERVPPVIVADRVQYGRRWRNGSLHAFIKRQKARAERRRARQNPECIPHYGRFKGYES